MLKAKQHTLPNGLRVVLAPMPDSSTVTVEVLVETGSKYESKKEAGLSHFLEHMCFKGTKKRPTALAVSTEFDQLGAISNAFTGTELTGYWAKAGFETLPQILDIVSDIYLNSIFKIEDIKKERGVIIEEMNMYEDEPRSIVGELFDKNMHGDQPAGRPIIGNKKSVSSFSIKDFEDYRKKHYVARATTVVVAGKFNEKKTLGLIKKLFTKVSHGKKHTKLRTKIVHRGARVALKYKDTDQAHLVIGVRAFHKKDKNQTILGVLRGILSSGSSSRLFHKMRTELGICYYVSAFNSANTDHGEFGVASGVDPKRIEEAVRGIIEELKRLKTELVGDKELKKVKASMVSKMYMSLETSDSIADYFASRAVFNHDLRTPKEREKAIMAVNAKQIQNISKKIFNNKDLLLAIVGKVKNTSRLKKLLMI